MTERAAKGQEAEERACRYLRSLGYSIAARNFRCRQGEIDIVAKHGETVVFVEVRSKSRSGYGTAGESINWAKRAKIVKAARFFAHVNGLDCPLRFDVVAIDGLSLDHVEDAFQEN